MRKYQKKQIQQIMDLLDQAQQQLLIAIEKGKKEETLQLLADCQDGAIAIGNMIEEAEGEGFLTVKIIEDYCEQIYQVHEKIAQEQNLDVKSEFHSISQLLMEIAASVINDIPTRLEAVFLPYKAAMWDSLESVWQAANEDPDCDAYVIPIPYYDRNPDGSFKEMHYEADLYPSDVPITKYDEYDFGKRQPDMIFIHNPYDEHNYVTSVHPFFYSKNLKQFTDCLIYIPYFATAGGFGEGQKLCSAYIYADYIVVQSEKYIDFYDEQIPREKFLPFGSPKFDSVIHKCQNPPTPPQEWQEMMAGKKVYFYNTSLSGMLADTDAFLKKMRYVFDTFKGRNDVCLLWRPHPLMESTFQSMRPEHMEQFQILKDEFIQDHLGIYDETPDIENTIALSDVYIGDAGTSVTSLFGVVGKPIFILDNYIHSLPDEDSWRGQYLDTSFGVYDKSEFYVSNEGQLWYSPNKDYHYKYDMTLDEQYQGGTYYLHAVSIGDKIYVIPRNARHLLIIQNRKIIKKIAFDYKFNQPNSFWHFWNNDQYIFIFPYNYPAMVRFDIQTEEITYTTGIADFNVRDVDGENVTGWITAYGSELVIASPTDNQFLFIEMDTLSVRLVDCDFQTIQGTAMMTVEDDEIWIMPMKGLAIVKWNPKTGKFMEYRRLPSEFQCIDRNTNRMSDKRPFTTVTNMKGMGGRKKIISPWNGNMFLELDESSGEMKRWNMPVDIKQPERSGYFKTDMMPFFDIKSVQPIGNYYRLWDSINRRLYNINADTLECKEIEIMFDQGDMTEHVSGGFKQESEWMQYCCHEDAFYSLQDLLDEHVQGAEYDREKALEAFQVVNTSIDGTCGKRVYGFIKFGNQERIYGK